MQAIHIPEVKTVKDEARNGSFEIEPLQRGYGVTLGNPLRRVLLSSLTGSAVTAFSIEGASHEFTTVEGVREDVVQIMLNLKQLKFRLYSDEPQTLKLVKQGKGPVTAADITANSNVETINPDHVIAHLDNDKAKLEMSLIVEVGRGYSPVDERQDQLPVDMIAVDATFTPVERVRYRIENTRVGQVTDLDKLIIDIDTDGTLRPKDALSQAAQILQRQLSVLTDDDGDAAPSQSAAIEELEIGLDDLELSSRTANALEKNGITTVGQLVNLTDSELKNLKGFGDKAYEEVANKLKELELR